MSDLLLSATKTAVRSYARSNFTQILEKALASGIISETTRPSYFQDLHSTLKNLREIEALLSAGATIGNPDEWVERISKAPDLLSGLKKGKAKNYEISGIHSATRTLMIALKESRLSELISEFETATKKIQALRWEAHEAASKAETAANKSGEHRDKAKNAIESQAGILRRLGKLEISATTKRDSIVASQEVVEKGLKRISEIETQAISSNREVSAIQKQLDALALSVTGHVEKMRDTESKVNIAISENTDETKKFLRKLHDIRGKAEDVLLVSTAAGLYRVFEARRKELTEKVRKGRNILFWVTLLGVVAAFAVWIFSAHQGWGLWEQVIAKAGIGFPIIFFLWLLTYHYNRERVLEEEYAHKASMSASYPAFRNEMLQVAGDDVELKRAAVHLSLDITREIFSDPLEAFKSSRLRGKASKSEPAPSPDTPDVLSAVPSTVKELKELVALIVKTKDQL